MEHQILYARTEDGVSIAYATVGEGAPVLYCPTQYLSMRWFLDDGHPELWLARGLAAHTRITLFDHAGMGASQRQVSDFSIDAQFRAIEAVAARLTGEPFTLVGMGAGAAGAALYAAEHRGGVRELVCLYPAASIITARFAATMREDWSLARRRLAGWAYPDSITNQRWFSSGMRESATADVAAGYAEAFARADLPAIYRRIPVPTLIIVGSEGEDREGALALASVVPDCRVATETIVGVGIAAAALEFMGIGAAQLSPAPARVFGAHGTAVILFADIVDSTALTERMGDAAFRAKARELDVELRRIIGEAGGGVIDAKTLGDGVLATFPAASQAIDAALRCGIAGAEGGLPLHLGLHAGDVIREQNNVFGGAVNIASRISALSAPGEVLVSDIVRGLARTSAGVTFADRGEHALKGIADAQRVYAVRKAGA